MPPDPTAQSFDPVLDASALDVLADRLRTARVAPGDTAGWERGMPAAWLAELIDDWRGHDPAHLRARLDATAHVVVRTGGTAVHALHQPGVGPDPLPLVLTHGWPSSVLEFSELVPMLADPGAHGADPADAFSVVVPSLPGFGFSAPPPPGGMPARDIADRWAAVMGALGYRRFAAHGGDLGAGVTAQLARRHPGTVVGIHLATPGLAVGPEPRTDTEARFAAEAAAWVAEEGGYAAEHATKPATVGAALYDSPVGLAAWIGEKVRAWSPVQPDGRPAFDRDLLLDTLTLYWVTGTAVTSLLPYWSFRHDPDSALPLDHPAPVPTAVSLFGGEAVPFPKPPRALAERYFSVIDWEEHDRGGHFPAVAEPVLLAQTMRRVFRPLRG